MNRTIAALLAAATMTTVATPATAQIKYYAREKIHIGPQAASTQPAEWSTGSWSEWSDTCSESQTQRTRPVSCMSGQTPVDQSSCTATRPAATETRDAYSGCTGLRWVSSERVKAYGCGTTSYQGQIMYATDSKCVSSGKVVADSACSSIARPAYSTFTNCTQINDCRHYLNGYGSQGGRILVGSNVFRIGTATPSGTQTALNAGTEMCSTHPQKLGACGIRANAAGTAAEVYGILPGQSIGVDSRGTSRDQGNSCR